jgi:transposase
VARILPDGTRKRATPFSGFLSHYLIRDRYGRPGKGNDKGAVEGLVGWARRNFMVPLPRFASWEDFNGWLEAQCRKRQRRSCGAIPRRSARGWRGTWQRWRTCRQRPSTPATRRPDG